MLNNISKLSTSASESYRKASSAGKSAKTSSAATVAGSGDTASAVTDTVELSAEGLAASENSAAQSSSSSASYDMSEIMRIHQKGKSEIPTKEESDYYWNVRENDPALDAELDAMDKADALKLVGNVQTILMKAVSGESLTKEEQEMVNSDPALQQEIQRRKMAAESGMPDKTT